ncbi:MAG: DMT family transporter [Gammaproteobacteria bacterium]|nr:DMT family transporter [Gammaproteobacteria bacterium]
MRAPHPRDWFYLAALTALWGSAFALNEIALRSFPPSIIVAGRIAIAACILLIVTYAQGTKLPRTAGEWLPMAVLAVFANVLPFQLIAWAQQSIESSLAGVLMAVMPLFVMTLAHFFIPGARLTRYRVAGFAVGFTGVIFVIGPEVLGGLGDNRALWGTLATLGAALSYSGSSVYARRISASDPMQLSVGMLIAASVLAIPLGGADIAAITAPTLLAVVSLFVLGSLSTGLATLIYFKLVQGPGPTFISFVNYLVPAWAVVAGAVFLDESLSPAAYVGLALILFGIAFSELGPRVWRSFANRLTGFAQQS